MKSKAEKYESAFFIVAKQWWNDFLQIRASHEYRFVKIYAHNELGVKKALPSMLYPITSRWIETPRHASRFVSLIDMEYGSKIGSENNLDIWPGLNSIISRGKGDLQSHCVLLCCLLLGFHLEAYITLGTDTNNKPHLWITTIDIRGKAMFWDVATGNQFDQQSEHNFRTVGCLFNNTDFYANIQVSDATEKVKFKLTDPSLWKNLKYPTPSKNQFTLLPSDLDIQQREIEVEVVLKQLIEYYRHDNLLNCIWDDSLSNLTSQCLWSMEYSKLSGQSMILFSDDFQIGVKKSIPEGHTFRGLPMCFNHSHPQRIMQSLIKNTKCKEIILTRGDVVRLSLRVKIFPYCESVHSCWVIVGSRALI